MAQNIQTQTLKKQNSFMDFLKKEIVLVIATVLAITSSFTSIPKLSYIDFKVLILLFNLMIVVAAFKELKVLDSIAIGLLKKCNTYTSISFALVFITFIASMIVTNDVALITFVPLSIVIARKANIDVLKIVIFQTLAANLGSSFTPMGNPQNLFIYSYYDLSPIDFLKATSPIVILAIVFLSILIIKGKKIKLKLDLSDVIMENKKDVILFSLLFVIILLSVFHLIDYRITFMITIVTVLILNKRLFKEVDYSLLLTFIGFFIFIGNISTMDVVRNFMENILNSEKSTFISSILASQIISNVPATMLLSGFTNHFKELLLGVNIGGMGTLIASLASVISYKIYTSEFKDNNDRYLSKFTLYNILGLGVFVPIIYLLLF
ncbi:anion transporter [Romboutsia ilealis]|uniref:Anion transporter n=1 Tax=Romboutsia faecis TaxID=2764597 RepID=A0ABR7JK50_9FIRM|nr:SLC13 family permease [Romboutsia faecis]MBC5995298.1 anion transporter [Romboutsia faecis]MRN24457.1 anion transporter [Romboutsia ilealis]